MSADRFPHAEGELVSRLGLARKRVRDVRASLLVRGDDWNHIGGVVRYSEAGQKKLLDALNVSPASAPLDPPAVPDGFVGVPPAVDGPFLSRPLGYLAPKKSEEPSGAPPPAAALKPAGEEDLVVTRKFLNRAIVQARFGKTLMRVRVKDSRKLVPGMFIRCQHIEKDLWKMTERLPRFVGKR
jgi:hypothetical protein